MPSAVQIDGDLAGRLNGIAVDQSADALRARRTTSASGWTTPVSLLANITDTSAGSSDAASARSSAARSTTPSPSTGNDLRLRSRPQHALVLDRRDQQAAPASAGQRHVVGFRAPRGEHDLGGQGADQGRDLPAAVSTRPRARRPARMHGRGIAARLQRLDHGVERHRPQRAGRVVVEIDEGGHGRRPSSPPPWRSELRVRRARRLADGGRQPALQHVQQGYRAQEGVDLVAELLPQVVGEALAAIGPAAGGAHFGAARGGDRLVDRQNDLRNPRLGRAARQAVTTAGATHALDQLGTAQAGKKLLEI